MKKKSRLQKEVNKNIKKYPIIGLAILLIYIGAQYFIGFDTIPYFLQNITKEDGDIGLHHCIDGDTAAFLIKGEKVTVRFSGVNTPEYSNSKKEEFGKEASDFTCRKLTNAGEIKIEWDATQTESYDRKVGIVFVDAENLNILLIEEGLADLKFLKNDMPYATEYKDALLIAEKNGIGRWR